MAIMRHPFVALLLTATGLQAGAQAPAPAPSPEPTPSPAARGPLCDQAVRFNAGWFADPEVDNSKTAAELTKLAPGGAGGPLQLGHVVVETKLSVVPQTACRGVVVRLDYVKPVLRVASEFAPGSCAHARVVNHELTHVRIHRDIARQFRELNYPWGASVSSAAVMAYAKLELDRLMRAQELFDSPEEYAKNHSLCGGEIARLVKPAAAPPKAAAAKAG
jgi:hypothetical protein